MLAAAQMSIARSKGGRVKRMTKQSDARSDVIALACVRFVVLAMEACSLFLARD